MDMNSPFPGMDPFLEARWPEVHASLIVYARNQINAQLPDDLQANIEENLSVRLEQEERTIRPDINVSEEDSGLGAMQRSSTVVVAEPILVRRPPYVERHVSIVNRAGRIITAIEFISPWNKVGARSRELYLRKQLDYLHAGTNLVEIDLVRQGTYVLNAPLEQISASKQTPYWVCVYRHIFPDQFELFPVPLQKPLPNIPIPLRPSEADAVLQLQLLLEACYRDGRYYRINYQGDPGVPLGADDAVWLDALLRSQRRRV